MRYSSLRTPNSPESLPTSLCIERYRVYLCTRFFHGLVKKKFSLFNNIDYMLNLHNVLSRVSFNCMHNTKDQQQPKYINICAQVQQKQWMYLYIYNTQRLKLPAAKMFFPMHIFGFLLNWNGLPACYSEYKFYI